MKVIKKQLKLSKIDYYEKHLNIIKNFLPEELTPKEIEVLAIFMSFEGDMARDRFGTTARKIVRSTTNPNISSGGLSNYLKSLKEKKFIKEEDDKNITIWSMLFPEEKEQGYMFKIIKENGST